MIDNNLLNRFLEAETSVPEERELAASHPAVGRRSEALAAQPLPALPDAGDEFDRILRQARRRSVRRWGVAAAGLAAALTGVFLLTRRPDAPQPAAPDATELLRQVQFISGLDPAGAESYDFLPVGDGFVMTARFSDSTTASFLLTPLDGGSSFDLVALSP